MTTIGLPLALWGEGYAEFLPRWWDGVRSLERKPDEIVLVSDDRNLQAVLDSVDENFNITVVQDKASNTYAGFWNRAIMTLTTDWVAICNVDDKFFPEALNDIDKADAQGCNLVCDQIQDLHGGTIHKSRWNGRDVGTYWSMVGAEPMKRDLFIKSGGFPEGYRFADWALAMHMYWQRVKAYDSDIVRIVYDRGVTRKTVSSRLHDPNMLRSDYDKLSALSNQLGY